MRSAEEKVPGGRLVKVSVDRERRVTISGDFFAHPEEGITLLENALTGLSGTETQADIETMLYHIVARSDIVLVGLDIPVIAHLFYACAAGQGKSSRREKR